MSEVFSEMSEINKLVHFTAYHISMVTIGETIPKPKFISRSLMYLNPFFICQLLDVRNWESLLVFFFKKIHTLVT